MMALLMGNGGSAPSMTQGHRWSIGGPWIGLTQPIVRQGVRHPGVFLFSDKAAFHFCHD